MGSAQVCVPSPGVAPWAQVPWWRPGSTWVSERLGSVITKGHFSEPPEARNAWIKKGSKSRAVLEPILSSLLVHETVSRAICCRGTDPKTTRHVA